MKKAFKAIADSSVILHDWKNFTHGLGVPYDEIEIIAYKEKLSLIEKCLEAMDKWKVVKGKRATRKVLIRYLRRLKHNDVAGEKVIKMISKLFKT